ncbi:hypothetical protein [Streptomyces sp. Inha503]
MAARRRLHHRSGQFLRRHRMATRGDVVVVTVNYRLGSMATCLVPRLQ